MADEASILRAAEAERDNARRLLAEHALACCVTCRSLAEHVRRTEKQVALLPAEAESEAMF